MTAVSISSVMLCWNRVELSRRCLADYLATVRVPQELIIVDNASTDGTREWLDGLPQDPRIHGRIHSVSNDPAGALNGAFERCSGRYLHVLENDYMLLPGWDAYVVERFERIPRLGQLSMALGAKGLIGEHHEGLVYLSLENVVTGSFFRRELFFDHGVRWANHAGSLPDDADFSRKVLARGMLVAWPDRALATSIGHSRTEFARDPDYYIDNYRRKLFRRERLGEIVTRALRLDFRDLRLHTGRLLSLYRMRHKRRRGGSR